MFNLASHNAQGLKVANLDHLTILFLQAVDPIPSS